MTRQTLLALSLLAAAGCAATPGADISRGRALTSWTSVESTQALNAASSPDLRALIAGGGGPAAFAQVIADQLGPELTVLDEQSLTLNGVTTYMRLARHEQAPAALTTAAWNADGVVLAAGIAPAPVAPTDVRQADTVLDLPFGPPREGEWLTFWGGSNALRNYHVVSPQQRHAYDLVVVRGDRTFEGEETRNESYFCWGEPILAAAAGRVVEAVDGIPDNTPGATNNPAQPAGNHVIIEHRAGEYSLSGHLKAGSVAVAVGETLARGQKIGECGNSGNSSEPHLHFHMQSAGAFGEGHGIVAPFASYLSDGRPVENDRPVRGERLRPAP